MALALPAFPAGIADSLTIDRFRDVARRLPPVHRAGFECRLGETDPRVDLQLGVAAATAEPAALAAYLAAGGPEPGTPLRVPWERVQALSDAWGRSSSPLHAGLREVWLEFDDQDMRAGDLTPSVFALLAPGGEDPGASAKLAEAVLTLLLGGDVASPLRRPLARIGRACPEGAHVSHVGVMLAREFRGVRIHVSRLPLRFFPQYLGRVGWTGCPSEAQRLARDLLEFVDQVVLCLEVGAEIQPQLGLECLFDRRQGIDPRWPKLLDHLVERGLCAPRKRAALLRWPGRVEAPHADVPWPDNLIAESLLQPPDRFGVVDRRLSHVKVSYGPAHPPSAKAYFGYLHAWLRPASKHLRAAVSASAAPTSTLDAGGPRLADLHAGVGVAIRFLLRARNQAGWWRDFYPLDRQGNPGRHETSKTSDEWVTAYVGAALAGTPAVDARRAARQAWDLLLGRRGRTDGWGYNRFYPADADSSTWALRLAAALGLGETQRASAARRFVERHMRSNGGITCYRAEDGPVASTAAGAGSRDGWCTVHTCITAAAAALDPFEGPLRYILGTQRGDGSWTGYWWEDDAYTTARAVEALARQKSAEFQAAAHRGARWAAERLDATSARDGKDSAFASALCVLAMTALRDTVDRPALDRAVGWLLARQRADGSFPPSAQLRIPPPSDVDPLARPEETVLYLDCDALFTTATVVTALVAARACYSGS
jgi:hypothetical protein